MNLRTLVFAATTLSALAACGGEPAAPEPIPGWVMDFSGGSGTTQTMPAVEALAWRYDNDEGGQTTDIWISSIALTPEQRSKLLPARSGQVFDDAMQPETLGLAGLLIHLDDSGDGGGGMLSFCVPADQGVRCNGGSGLGTALLRRFDAQSIAGTYYTRDSKGMLYAAVFEAKVQDQGSQPLPADVSWNTDGGEAGKAFLAKNQAALDGDITSLKKYAMPERAADFDEPATLKIVQRMALKKPAVLSARNHGKQATLWVRDSVGGKFSPGVIRVNMQQVDGQWRVAGTQMN